MNTLIKYYKKINRPVIQSSIPGDILLQLPRLICGMLLTLSFGSDKFGMPWSPPERDLGLFEVVYWFPADVAEFGGIFAMFPAFFAWMGAFSEAVGGLLLAFGFNTRFASLLILCTMLVAIFFQHGDSGLWQMLPAAGFIWVALYGLVLGSGRLGLDYLIDQKLK